MKKKALILIALLFAGLVDLSAQIAVKGNVTGVDARNKPEPLQFATVVVKDITDSSIVAHSLTDLQGDYVLEKLNNGTYLIEVSYMGFISLSDTLCVPMPTEEVQTITKDYVLTQDIELLDVVVITASDVLQGIGNKEYTITRRDLQTAVHGLDLIDKIPQIQFDPANQRLRAINGGAIKILVNGANADEMELMSIDAENIKKIVHYDFPPARYAGYSHVINVITKKIDDGFYGGVNLQHALTTGFANDGLYLKYNWGQNQISVNANTYWRNYRNVQDVKEYEFTLGSSDYLRCETGRKRFGYDDNHIDIRYTRNIDGKYLLQATFSPNFQHSHNEGDKNVIQEIGLDYQERYGDFNRKTTQFTPSLDLYGSVTLPKKYELTVNLLGTYMDASRNYVMNEYDVLTNECVLWEDMTQINNKLSGIGIIEVAKNFNNGMRISLGNNTSYEHLASDVVNYLSQEELNKDYYEQDVFSTYIYGEVQGLYKKKLTYIVSAGAEYYSQESNHAGYDNWTPRINALLGYSFKHNITSRLMLSSISKNPSLNQISGNKQLISEGIARAGNPYLKNELDNFAALSIDYSNQWLTFQIGGLVYYNINAINSYFIEEDDYMQLKYENCNSLTEYEIQSAMLIDPFEKKYFTLTLGAKTTWGNIDSDIIGSQQYFNWTLMLQAVVNYKGFTLSYVGNIPGIDNSGTYVRTPEKMSTLSLRYVWKGFTFSATCMWFLADAKYKTWTVDGSVVDYSSVNNIIDNSNMVTLGISYRFNVGKKYFEGTRRFNEKDTDSGLF